MSFDCCCGWFVGSVQVKTINVEGEDKNKGWGVGSPSSTVNSERAHDIIGMPKGRGTQATGSQDANISANEEVLSGESTSPLQQDPDTIQRIEDWMRGIAVPPWHQDKPSQYTVWFQPSDSNDLDPSDADASEATRTTESPPQVRGASTDIGNALTLHTFAILLRQNGNLR
jgi:hypothetical protein